MNRAKDLIGRRFGRLTVIRRAGTLSDGSASWDCRCDCGNIRVSIYRLLRSGRVYACKDCRVIPGGWSQEEENKLREIYPTSDTDTLVRIFGRGIKAIRSRAKILKVQKAIGHGGKMIWNPEMESRVRDRYPETATAVLAAEMGISISALTDRAYKLGVHKTGEHIARTLQECGRQFAITGRAHRFQKGLIPQNKGLRRPGYHRGRMRETQFRKGQSPRNTMPLWSFRWVNQGASRGRGKGTAYMMLKTGKPGRPPYGGWEFVHKLVWEHAHGPIAPGYRIWWKDGDHANNSLSNLELLSAQDHMSRTTIHNLPAPLKEVIQLAGVLKRKINRRQQTA